jgi:prevent-host-death family protein
VKVLGLREAKQTLSECIDKAQKERVLITKHGKPAAIVIGVAGQDLEDVLLEMDPKFWEMIETRRRSSSTLSLEEVRRRYGFTQRAKGKRKPKK